MRALLILLLASGPAWASPRGDWFSSLKIPATGGSCCDVSDCHQTEAEFRGTSWWAKVEGEWTLIPKEKVLVNPKTLDGEAYVCNSPTRQGGGFGSTTSQPSAPIIYCFVPPTMGF